MSDQYSKRNRAYDTLYPEHRMGGYVRHDGAVAFNIRAKAVMGLDALVCDFGCGRGFHKELYEGFARDIQIFRGNARHVIGIDVDDYASENPYIDEFVLMRPMEARIPLETASVDLVVTEWVFEHLPEPMATLDELSRILRPGGHLCIRTPNLWHYSCLGALAIPHRLHHKVRKILRQPHESEDVFPTLYRCNTQGRMRRALVERGFDAVVYRHRGPSHFTEAGRLLGIVGECIERFSPPMFRHELHAFGRKVR